MHAQSRSPFLPLALLLLDAVPALDGSGTAASDRPPQALSAIQPVRPSEVFDTGQVKGEVDVIFTIETAALAAFRQWTFAPAVKNGRAVAVRARQALTFDEAGTSSQPRRDLPITAPQPTTMIATAK